MSAAIRLISYAVACAENDSPARRIQVYRDAAELTVDEAAAAEFRLLADGLAGLGRQQLEIDAVRSALEQKHQQLLLKLLLNEG